MPSFLQIENISKSYGQKILLENIGFNINEGDKIALVAPNGTGKSTLLRILAGRDKSDSGGRILFLRDIGIAFLDQNPEVNPDATIEEQILFNHRELLSQATPQVREDFFNTMRQTAGGFRLGNLSRRMGELSGGEVKRVALTGLLSRNAEFLILDEPTNHLDIEAIEYLESALSRRRCTLLMVTHDRYFLDRVCNTVMELDRGAVYTYKGNYQNYLEKRDARIANYNAETDKVRNLLRRELEWIHATPCARSGKAKYRKDAFRALADRASQVYTTRQISLEGASQSSRLGSKIIDCHDISFAWGGEMLLKDFDYKFQRYERVGIVGRNGIGKSTFLDLISGRLAPSSGTVELGESLIVGHYRQEGMQFREDDTVMDIVSDIRLLGRFLFPHDMLSTRIGKLSGGERRRLYLLTVLMKNPNVLILDEPTNDLDIVTLNILEEYLLEFRGTLIIVSHDRHFMDRIVDHLLVFTGDGRVKDFVGNFSEYRSFIKDCEASQKAAAKALPKPGENRVQVAEKKKRLSWKEQRELEEIDARLPRLEEQKAQLEAQMSSGELSFEELQEAGRKFQELSESIDELEMRWLELSDNA